MISGYAMPLLEGCGTIEKGELRVIARPGSVPFIGVFATDRVSSGFESRIWNILRAVRDHRKLLSAMESKDGFVRLPPLGRFAAWPDWRGPKRGPITDCVPSILPRRKRLLWSRVLTGPGMSGLAVAFGRVLVADKDSQDKSDMFRCLDADTGGEMWRLEYPAAGAMDFTNSPRANPVIYGGLVYLLGAFGHLHCVKLKTGEVLWERNLIGGLGVKLW